MESIVFAAAIAAAGCAALRNSGAAGRTEQPEGDIWRCSEWLSAADAKVADKKDVALQRAADGTSWFVGEVVNESEVKRAVWTTTGLGVYEAYVNGRAVGEEFLKPGFTHSVKTKYAFSYDVTGMMKLSKGEKNLFAAEVSSGWWRDMIVHYAGRKSAFRAVLQITYTDGSVRRYGTERGTWKAGTGGPVTHAGIFDGEECDARIAPPFSGEGLSKPEANDEFKGRILPSDGAEVYLRRDLAMQPLEAYCWNGTEGDNGLQGKDRVFGKVKKTAVFARGKKMILRPGETLVADFGQNAAAVPFFRFRAAEGVTLTALPGEMLNEGNGACSRGNDGPEGSLYRKNLRIPANGMRVVYTFGKNPGWVEYHPRFTFFGFRYISVTATGEVEIDDLESVPVTSITREMEHGRLTTGDAAVNQLVSNILWGQRSNYLSVPTDCPQRNERLGWTADTQVFCEAGTFNADTRAFFRKWMRDLVDTQRADGSYTGVAPLSHYGDAGGHRVGWSDAGVIVPWTIWKQFGERGILEDNWDSMMRYMRLIDSTKFASSEALTFQWGDWLSFEALESAGGTAFEPGPGGKGRKPKEDAKTYWRYLGACYWLRDARMMAQMGDVIGKKADADACREMAARALAHLRKTFVDPRDGMLIPLFRKMQTPALFALHLGIVEGAARNATLAGLVANIHEHGNCLQTGFLGTSILMDTLTECGQVELAYTLLLQHENPSWLYSVDQGATTIWERWNSYRKADGFGPVGMNSFNHYAYGSVLAWMYKTVAGIAADPADPGFATIVMAPIPDRRLGQVSAEYRTPKGWVKSAWRYDGDKWTWKFTVPPGSKAKVTVPGEKGTRTYDPGSYTVVKRETENGGR